MLARWVTRSASSPFAPQGDPQRVLPRDPLVRRHEAGPRAPAGPGRSSARRSPVTMPTARSAITECRRSGSRAKMLERCSSTKGTCTASSASRSARLEWVSAAALIKRAVGASTELLHRVDQRALVVGLEPIDLDAVVGGGFADHRFDLGQRGAPVDLRLPLPQEVQVGAVEHRDPHSALQVLQPGVELVEIVVLRVGAARGPGAGGRA